MRQRVLQRARPHPSHIFRGRRQDAVPVAGERRGGRDGGRPPQRDGARVGARHRRGKEVAKVYQGQHCLLTLVDSIIHLLLEKSI